jgi:tol-pal system protein YbgF
MEKYVIGKISFTCLVCLITVFFFGCATHEPVMHRLDKIEAVQQTERSESKAENVALMRELENVSMRLDAMAKNQANLLDSMATQREMLQRTLETMRYSRQPEPPSPGTNRFFPDTDHSEFQSSDTDDQTSAHAGNMDRQQPEAVYQTAYNDYLNRNYDLAILAFRNFLNSFPSSNLADNAQYWIGECYYAQKQFDQALVEFEKVLTLYPDGDKSVSALLKKGLTYLETGDVQRGRSVLETLIDTHPYSSEAKIAEDRLR